MAWGGFGGPSASASSGAAGLPFAGIPSELAERAEAIVETEPEHPDPGIAFSQVSPERGSFTVGRFLFPHRSRLAAALALVMVETVAMQIGPLLTSIAIDQGVLKQRFAVVVAAVAAYAVAIVVNMMTARARIAFTGRLGERLTYELRIRLFSHLQRLSLDYYTNEKAGRLLSRMTADIEALSQLFQDGIVNLAAQGLTLLVIIVVLFILNPLLATITLVLVIPVMLVLTLWFRKASEGGYRRVRDRVASVLADLSESLAGIRVITAYNRRRFNTARHIDLVGSYYEASRYTAKVGSMYGPGSEAVGLVGQGLVLLIGGRMVLDGRLAVGELTAFVLYLTAFFTPIQQLVQLFNGYQQGQAAVSKIGEVLDMAPSVPEAPDASDIPALSGRIQLEGVSFSYADGAPVLSDVDLDISPGEMVALVGPTGAGKSTIAKLIARFYDPTSGSVRVDGHDLREVTLRSLRTQLGVVPQEPFLFNGSIRDNLTFARDTIDDDELHAAVELLGLDRLVERLPEGVDAPVHERGASLSTGERQLLALGRAFLAQPRVLVLDEATSNLDLRSEAQIDHALEVVLAGRTAVVIAHRLATAMRADRIAVIDGGRLVELGPPAELIEADGYFARMYRTWLEDAQMPSPAP